jgi:tetratricopeptide (TPR) repeat protein
VESSEEFNTLTKIGRNDNCPCGSGKKYKKCCLDKQPIRNDLSGNYEEALKILWSVPSDRLDPEIKKNVFENPSILQSHETLTYVGAQLGVIGFPNQALYFQRKALELRPRNNGYKLNFAATLSMAGQYAEAFKLIAEVPDSFERKNVIMGNILFQSGSAEKAIPFYERAIEDEPDFYLPYLNLIDCNSENLEIKNYWINRAFENFSQTPSVVKQWVLSKLDYAFTWNELHEHDWVTRLSGQVDNTVVDSVKNTDTELEFLYIFADIVSSSQQKDTSHFQNSILELRKVTTNFPCSVIVYSLASAIKLGALNTVSELFPLFCPECAKNYSLDEIRFETMTYTDQKEEALELGRKILLTKPTKQMLIADYISLLDDLGRTDEAVSEAIKLTEKYEISDISTKARLYYDLANYAAQLGVWGTVEYALDEFSKIEMTRLLELGDYFLTPISNLVPNKILAKIGKKEFELAKGGIKELYKMECMIINDTIFELREEFRQKVSQDLLDILHFATDHSSEIDFNNLLAQKISETYFKDWSGKTRRIKLPTSISTLLMSAHKDDISTRIASSITAFKLKQHEDNDYSEALTNISKHVPNLKVLNEEVLRTLIDAETNQFSIIKSHDFAPIIMSYCKALELFLRQHVLARFRYQLMNLEEFNEIMELAKIDKKFAQFKALVTYVKTERVELGSVAQVLKLLQGSTASRVQLLSNLREHLEKLHPYLIDSESVELIQKLASNFRNLAVHERAFTEDESLYVREAVLTIFAKCNATKVLA